MQRYIKCLTLFLAIFLLGCNANATRVLSPTFPAGAYPQPNSTAVSLKSYPSPSANPQSQWVIPTPSSLTGVISGILTSTGDARDPYLTNIYLARIVPPNQAGFPPLLAFSEKTSQKAIQDKSGKFYINNIQPGSYSLVMSDPGGSSYIPDTKTGNAIIIDVKAAQTYELGILSIQK